MGRRMIGFFVAVSLLSGGGEAAAQGLGVASRLMSFSPTTGGIRWEVTGSWRLEYAIRVLWPGVPGGAGGVGEVDFAFRIRLPGSAEARQLRAHTHRATIATPDRLQSGWFGAWSSVRVEERGRTTLDVEFPHRMLEEFSQRGIETLIFTFESRDEKNDLVTAQRFVEIRQILKRAPQPDGGTR